MEENLTCKFLKRTEKGENSPNKFPKESNL